MKNLFFDRFKAYLLAQAAIPASEKAKFRPAITISRETGAGAITIAQLLADYLQSHQRETNCPWAIFDRNLIHHVLEDHLLPKNMASFMPEDSVPLVRDTIEEILGLHPSAWTLLQHTSETISKLAQRGNTIIVGRGSHLVTKKLKNVFHVRLVAPLAQRIRHMEDFCHFNSQEAEKYIAQWDDARKCYVEQNFQAKIDDPLTYHLTINTGRISYEEAARLIGSAVLHC